MRDYKAPEFNSEHPSFFHQLFFVFVVMIAACDDHVVAGLPDFPDHTLPLEQYT